MVGAPGAEADGVTELLGGDDTLVPPMFVAVTVNRYAVPLVKPVMTIGLAEPETVKLPGMEVTV
jgi:hypothetical protein